jgi:hypothetical protein
MSSSVGDDIARTAKKKDIDLLIIGCHHSYVDFFDEEVNSIKQNQRSMIYG